MGRRTLTRAEIAFILQQKHQLQRNDACVFVSSVIDTLTHALNENEEVKIPLFGVFNKRYKKPRIGRNPKTLEETPIDERTVVSFRVSRIMRERVNKAFNARSTKLQSQ